LKYEAASLLFGNCFFNSRNHFIFARFFKMNLIIDIGNTRTKVAFFNKNILLEKATIEILTLGNLSELVQRYPITGTILSATGKITEGVEEKLRASEYFIQLDHTTLIPIVNRYNTPETLGKDRLAAVVAAYYQFPNKNCLVVDSGTCITYNVLTAAGAFLGGSISPGLSMRLKAMHHFTARLPEVTRKTEGVSLFGKTTEAAMQSGAQIGLLSEVEGFIKRFKKELGSIKLIITGGDGEYLYHNLNISHIHYDPNLVLKGLNQILNYNILMCNR
jgi:type III pantothenate kinase